MGALNSAETAALTPIGVRCQAVCRLAGVQVEAQQLHRFIGPVSPVDGLPIDPDEPVGAPRPTEHVHELWHFRKRPRRRSAGGIGTSRFAVVVVPV
jgi:hypothetical protein